MNAAHIAVLAAAYATYCVVCWYGVRALINR